MAYARDGEAVLLTRALFLPDEWTEVPGRCAVAGIPPTVAPATKPTLAQRMLARAFAAGYEPDWVTGDEVYSRAGYLRRFLEENGRAYVLEVASNTHVWHGGKQRRPRAILDDMPPETWQRLSCGDGGKGPRVYDWAWTPIQTRQDPMHGTPGRHHLLFRRPVDNPEPEEVAYFIVYSLAPVTLVEAVAVAGQRWPIERCFQDTKGLVGLDEYEVRGWLGWHRHITLAMLAYALLVVLTRRARVLDANVQPDTPPPLKKRHPALWLHSAAAAGSHPPDGAGGLPAALLSPLAIITSAPVALDVVAVAARASSPRARVRATGTPDCGDWLNRRYHCSIVCEHASGDDVGTQTAFRQACEKQSPFSSGRAFVACTSLEVLRGALPPTGALAERQGSGTKAI